MKTDPIPPIPSGGWRILQHKVLQNLSVLRRESDVKYPEYLGGEGPGPPDLIFYLVRRQN